MRKMPYILFVTTLVFSPLAFGTVEQWSLLTVELLICSALTLYSFQSMRTSGKLIHVPGIIPLLLLIGWMVFQLIPLPIFLVKLLSPSTYQVYKPIYDMLEGSKWMPLTVYQKGSVQEFIRITSCILFYILTIQMLSGAERLKRTVKICSWLAIGVAALAIIQKFSSSHAIYWFRQAPLDSTPVGPWINHSQYCGYMEMISPVVLALLLYYKPVVDSADPLRARIVAFFTMAGGNPFMLLGMGLTVLVLSIFISLSRGGIIAFTFSLVFFFIILRKRQPRFSNLFFLGFLACLFASVAFWVGWGSIIERFGHVFTADEGIKFDRIPIWRDSLKIIKDFWLTGSGLGTFVNIFPNYKTIPDNYVYDHAHNDYLELLTDGGIVGFGLVAWFIISVILSAWKMIFKRRDRYSILVSIGALTGIIAMLIHSLSDFNMHNGADGLYFFFLCGLLISAGNTRLQYRTESTLLARISWPPNSFLLAPMLLFFSIVVVVQGGVMLASIEYNSVKNIYLSRQLSETYLQQISSAVKKASLLDPFEGMYLFLLGDVERFLGHPDKALAYYVQAGKKEPLEGAYLQRIGLMLPKDHRQFAEVLMEKGSVRTLKKDDLMLARAEWLLGVGERDKGIDVLQNGLRENSRLITAVIPLLQSSSFTREETERVLPASVDAWIQYGVFMDKTGNTEDADYFLGHALSFLDREKVLQTSWFTKLYGFYTKHKRDEKALEILRIGISKIPDYAPLHIWLGDAYAKEGIIYRAKEEYQQALLLEPMNESARIKLDKITRNQPRE